MERVAIVFTVIFEDPFWVGIYERECNHKYEVCKITFGSEPKNYDVYYFMLANWINLRFSPTIELKKGCKKRVNPKRMQREINKQLNNTGIGTKAQQALKLQHEEVKIARKIHSHKQRADEKEKNFELKQAKRHAKHRGH